MATKLKAKQLAMLVTDAGIIAAITTAASRSGATYTGATTGLGTNQRYFDGVWTYIFNGTTLTRYRAPISRVTPVASSATPTPNCDTTDQYEVTALATGATFGAPTGTPYNGQKLLIKIKDDSTVRTLAWNAIYRPIGLILPTQTLSSDTIYVGCIYNSASATRDVVAVGNENGSPILSRVESTTAAVAPTPNADTTDQYELTALSVGATFGAPTGTPQNGQKLLIRILDNGTAQTLAWNSIYRAISAALPTTTVLGKTMYIDCVYNGADVKRDVVTVSVEGHVSFVPDSYGNGSPVGVVTPLYIGWAYIDLDGPTRYRSYGLTNVDRMS